ncbi:Torsin-1B [Cryptotermes secundus]|uniref:Torsin-1B n=1 Tax=Cryptotermes secundus TaxID=105785 RepID=A0A2J7QV80_9NEOP|nr:torsin-1A [Cryptotermes secundus]PNF32483.1 Torsin-1B [Cryptotermes secundus]PNF32484.1 Torsin-1B [Cryptotermes secundus]PNF32485.1 Torsin-1B [Cryptotermes secundus]PNF32486.1 Torsin-1B [Cryptotermes secundus]
MICDWKIIHLFITLLWTGTIASFDPLSVTGIGVGAGSMFSANWNKMFCILGECCYEIPHNLTMLESSLKEHLFGQHIARDVVTQAIKAHFKDPPPGKALVLSFNGLPGGGKTFVSQFIIKSLYKSGLQSQYVHYFNGRTHFPLKSKTDIYKIHLGDWIRGNVSQCGRSLFLFDEVDKTPEGVLDGVKPFLDYHEHIDGIDFRKATFIFVSNTGSQIIAEKLLEFWEKGGKRENLQLSDFEDLLRKGLFNEKGGFYKSDTIESNLIDHYVPFLPLEESHIRQCIEAEFHHRGKEIPHEEVYKEVLKGVTFGPGSLRLFAHSGCKRISSKVAALLESPLFTG